MSARTLTAIATVGLLSLVGAAGVDAATVSGKVKYEGRTPNLKPLQMDADPACAAKHSAPVKAELMVLGQDGALANVFVWVRSGLPEKQWPVPGEPAVINQTGCIYTPHMLGVQLGQGLKILNSDSLLHNLHSMSEANPPFNRAMPANVKEAEFTFKNTEEMFKIKCDVHPWMGAWVNVVDHPFFAVSAEDGSFEIEGLPAGTYEIAARHEYERFPVQTLTVTVGADEEKTVDFTFQGPK